MPINRAPFNALVDDSGNGLTGSIWNKAAIAGVILDPIDALVGSWIAEPYVAGNFIAGTAGATWTVPAGAVSTNRYAIVGKVMFWTLYLTATTLTNASQNLFVRIPGGRLAGAAWTGVNRCGQIYDAVSGDSQAIIGPQGPGVDTVSVQKNNNVAWQPGMMPVLLASMVMEIQ